MHSSGNSEFQQCAAISVALIIHFVVAVVTPRATRNTHNYAKLFIPFPHVQTMCKQQMQRDCVVSQTPGTKRLFANVATISDNQSPTTAL